MTGALRRVLGAPGLVVTVAAVQLAVAAVAGTTLASAVAAAMGRYAAVADGHLLYSTVALFADHPGIPAGARDLLAGSALLALALWTLLAAGILHRLQRPATASEVAAAAVHGLPAVIVVTLWQLLPRLVLIALVGAWSAKILADDDWGWLGLLPLVAVLGYVACALDLARCAAVLHGARRYHVMTALGGFARALRRPGVLLPSMVFSACQWVCVASILAVSIWGWGSGWASWAARALAVAGIIFGLARMAVAVSAGPPRPRQTRSQGETAAETPPLPPTIQQSRRPSNRHSARPPAQGRQRPNQGPLSSAESRGPGRRPPLALIVGRESHHDRDLVATLERVLGLPNRSTIPE